MTQLWCQKIYSVVVRPAQAHDDAVFGGFCYVQWFGLTFAQWHGAALSLIDVIIVFEVFVLAEVILQNHQ